VIAEELGRSLAPDPVRLHIYLAAEALLLAAATRRRGAGCRASPQGEAIGCLALSEGAQVPTRRELATPRRRRAAHRRQGCR
jgi:hypothetical protein